MAKNWRVESRESGLTIYDAGEDSIPGVGGLNDEDVMKFLDVQSQWSSWQFKLREIYRAQVAGDDDYRTKEKERAELARLKAKYES